MPTININNTELNFNNVYYVDPVNGSDTNSGSVASPFKTVQKAVSVCASSWDAVYALEGTHDVTTVSGSYGKGGLDDSGKSISFVGIPNKTIFLCDGVKNTGRDHHAICTYGTGTKIYNIIFDIRMNGRTTNYMNAIFGRDYTYVKAEVYNCVFKHDGTAPSLLYDNSGGSSLIKVYNCSFDVATNFVGSYSGVTTATLTLVNSVCNRSFYNEGTKVSTLDGVSYDSEYSITSSGWRNVGQGTDIDGTPADLGVYGGQFSWVNPNAVITIPNPSATVLKNTDYQFDFSIKSPLTVYKTVAKAMTDEGSVGSGRILSGVIDKSQWLSIDKVEVV